jgi:hypothetical protein
MEAAPTDGGLVKDATRVRQLVSKTTGRTGVPGKWRLSMHTC